MLVLDDLQWVGPGSGDLLFRLARGVAGHRVLLVGAYRSEEAAPRQKAETRSLVDAIEELLTGDGSVRIDLTRADGRTFVDALLDSEPNALRRAFRLRLDARTSGNPLFTIELLRAMQRRGDLQRDRHGRWVGGPGLRWDDVPARVEAVIECRLAHLSATCRDLLTVAAVEGEQFTAQVAGAVTGLTTAHACELLSDEAGRRHQLVAAHTVRRVGGASLALYRFRHGLVQTYLERRLDPVERARLHGRVACELQHLYRSDADRRAPRAGAVVEA